MEAELRIGEVSLAVLPSTTLNGAAKVTIVARIGDEIMLHNERADWDGVFDWLYEHREFRFKHIYVHTIAELVWIAELSKLEPVNRRPF
jgi:hypothetical protein